MKRLLLAFALAFCSASYADFIKVDADGDGVKDFRVATFDLNKNAGNCTLALHGNSAPFVYLLQSFLELGSKGKCVISFDLPGHGLTQNLSGWDWSTKGSMRPYLAALQGVISHYNLQNYNAYGWSLGGDILLQAWQRGYLTGASKLGLIGTPPVDFGGHGLPIGTNSGTCAAEAIAGSYNLSDDLTTQQKIYLTSTYFENCQTPSPLFTAATLATEAGQRNGILVSVINGEIFDEVDILGTVNIPVFFGFGQQDAWINGGFMDALVNGGFFSAPPTYVKFDTGHAVITEAPHTFTTAWLNFIN